MTPASRERLHGLVQAALAKATRDKPMAQGDVVRAVRRHCGDYTQDEVHDALEAMQDARQLYSCHITRGGVGRHWWWPTGLAVPAVPWRPLTVARPHQPARLDQPEPHQPKPEPETAPMPTIGEKLYQALREHGPMYRVELANKARANPSSLEVLLKPYTSTGQVVTRIGYAEDLGRNIKHWMTAEQAVTWDAGEQGAADATEQIKQETVANAPATEPSHANQPDTGQTSEREQHILELIAERDSLLQLLGAADIITAGEAIGALHRRVHDLTNDAAGLRLILEAVARRMDVGSIEQVPDALDHLQSTRQHQTHGRLAMLLIDSADQVEIEDLDCADLQPAQKRALAAIDQGHAARAVVIRILGEAQRLAEWREAA